MKTLSLGTAIAVAISTPVFAQDAAPAPMPLQVQQRNQGNAVLPANTEITLRMNQEVTTRGNTWSEGDTFYLTVANDVMLGDYVVIPQGSRGVGRITWLTSRGAFGKSGKMDIELEHVEVNGTRIAVDGTYRQEGEGNTLATVGGVVLAGVFAGFITGRSGTIPADRELTATTESNLELAIPASAVRNEASLIAPLATQNQPMNVAAASAPTEIEETDSAEAPMTATSED